MNNLNVSSAQILATFYGRDKVLSIKLKSGEILNGILVGFFHGDTTKNEPYIYMWRFVSENEIDDFKLSPDKYLEFGRKFLQTEIAAIDFK